MAYHKCLGGGALVSKQKETPLQANLHDRALYELLHMAREDLHQAAFFAAHLQKKGWHFEPWERRWSTYMQQSAYTTGLVVAYSRPFADTRGRPKFPKRLLPLDKKQEELHSKILEIRNSVYAHSDAQVREIRPWKINGQPSAIEYLPSMRLTKEEIDLLLGMISQAQNAIHKRLLELIEAIPHGV
jgi:hypothetical protein